MALSAFGCLTASSATQPWLSWSEDIQRAAEISTFISTRLYLWIKLHVLYFGSGKFQFYCIAIEKKST